MLLLLHSPSYSSFPLALSVSLGPVRFLSSFLSPYLFVLPSTKTTLSLLLLAPVTMLSRTVLSATARVTATAAAAATSAFVLPLRCAAPRFSTTTSTSPVPPVPTVTREFVPLRTADPALFLSGTTPAARAAAAAAAN